MKNYYTYVGKINREMAVKNRNKIIQNQEYHRKIDNMEYRKKYKEFIEIVESKSFWERLKNPLIAPSKPKPPPIIPQPESLNHFIKIAQKKGTFEEFIINRIVSFNFS